jgi:hypothetical protein
LAVLIEVVVPKDSSACQSRDLPQPAELECVLDNSVADLTLEAPRTAIHVLGTKSAHTISQFYQYTQDLACFRPSYVPAQITTSVQDNRATGNAIDGLARQNLIAVIRMRHALVYVHREGSVIFSVRLLGDSGSRVDGLDGREEQSIVWRLLFPGGWREEALVLREQY